MNITIPGLDWWQLGWMLTGLFFILFLVTFYYAKRNRPYLPAIRKHYITEIPSKLIIDEESTS
jgi:hypothetical protein